ncbi:MAG: hypothetical protein SPL13_01860 [Clostridia bacterium]|nr:hypothetical protein [Clostridia bacterium]
MKYYVKCSLFAFAYLVAMDIGALLLSYISIVPLRVALSVVWALFYCFIVGVIFFKEGETSLDFRHANDLERKHMVESGEIVELDIAPEYKPYKGFIIGLYACIPLLVALFVHLILGLATGGTANGAGITASVIYFTFYMIYGAFQSGLAMSFGEYFIILYTLVFIPVTIGVAYILGAKKAQRKYDIIEEKRREIYGDDK